MNDSPIVSTVDFDAVEQCLEVGRPAVLYIDKRIGGECSVRVIIRGWQRGSYVLLDTPSPEGLGVGTRPGDPCRLRFLADGDACSLDVTLQELGSGRSFSYLRVTWPHHMVLTRVRKHQRLRVRIRCVLTVAENQRIEGEINDLSAGGCRIELDQALDQGTKFKLSFELPDGMNYEDIATTACASGSFAGGAWIGCKFDDLPEPLRYEIDFFVAWETARHRSGHGGNPTLLVIAPDLGESAKLRQTLLAQGYDVTIAPSVVDGFFWLRTACPGVLLLHTRQTHFAARDIVQAVRDTRSLRGLPVIVFGCPEAQHAALAQAGATQCLVADAPGSEIVSAVAACLKQAAKPTAAQAQTAGP